MEQQLGDLVEYLAGKGYQPKKAAGSEVRYPCFFDCNEDPNSRKRKLYLNTEEGFYHCKVCDARGGSTLLLRRFGDDEKVSAFPGSNPGERRRILDEATSVGQAILEAHDDQLLYLLNERGLSAETILERRFGFVTGRRSLVGSVEADRKDLESTGLVYRDGPRRGQDFFYHHLLIPYVTRGQVVQLRGKVPGGKYMTGPGESVRLYNTDSLDDAEDVIVTEGEFDSAVLEQCLKAAPEERARRIGVVGLPGTGSLPGGFTDYFTHAKRVFLGLDPDDPGKRAAVKIKEELGSRARILELPEGEPKCDWTEFLLPVPANADAVWQSKHPYAGHGWRDVLELMGNASGKRLYSVGEAGRRWRNARSDNAGVKTGWHQLDETILPGMLPGQLCVVLAKTGSGKTIMLCNLAYNLRDIPTLFISLEQTQEEVYERLHRIYLHHDPLASDEEMERAFSQTMICEENRLNEKDLALLVDEFLVEVGEPPQVILLDYVGYYARGMAGHSPYEKVSNAVMQLKAEAKRHRVVMIAPHQVSRVAKEGKPIGLDDARDSGVVEETADFMFSAYRPDDALRDQDAQPSGKLRLEVNKSRHGGKGRVFTLLMDVLTLRIVEDGTSDARLISNHNYHAWRGETYEDLRKKETRPVQQVMGA